MLIVPASNVSEPPTVVRLTRSSAADRALVPLTCTALLAGAPMRTKTPDIAQVLSLASIRDRIICPDRVLVPVHSPSTPTRHPIVDTSASALASVPIQETTSLYPLSSTPP